MKNKLLIAVASLFGFAVLLHNFEKPVLAQIRAALTKNIDERGRSPYMVHGVCGGTPGINFCQANFPAVPANKRFVVEYINGTIFVQGPDFVDAVLTVPSPSGTFPTVLLSTHLESNLPDLYYIYAISMPLVIYYEGDEIPSAVIARESKSVAPNVNITLSGYLVDLTQ